MEAWVMKRLLAKVLFTDEGEDEVYPRDECAAKGYGGEEERGKEPEHLKISVSLPLFAPGSGKFHRWLIPPRLPFEVSLPVPLR